MGHVGRRTPLPGFLRAEKGIGGQRDRRPIERQHSDRGFDTSLQAGVSRVRDGRIRHVDKTRIVRAVQPGEHSVHSGRGGSGRGANVPHRAVLICIRLESALDRLHGIVHCCLYERYIEQASRTAAIRDHRPLHTTHRHRVPLSDSVRVDRPPPTQG
jgi:hypothetical protein